mgnify:CR=1 FL=1
MKTKICVVLLAFWLAGCNDFLKESSQDEIRPSTVTDLEEILLGDGYLDDYGIYNLTDILTDNIQCNGMLSESVKSYFEEREWLFRWEDDMFAASGGGNNPNFWEVPYKGIGTCNVILDMLDRMYGETEQRESVRGEVLALRAWYYFQLVNFFGYPYNYGDPAKNLGVPLKLDSDVTDERFPRNSVAEVYLQIVADLLEGNRLLTKYDFKRDYFRIGHLAVKAMLSRVYLYMEDWDKALAYADSVLQVKPGLLDLNRFGVPDLDAESRFITVYGPTTPDEIIWAREYHATNAGSPVGGKKYPYTISREFLDLVGSSYDACKDRTLKDLRGAYYFSWGNDYDDWMTPMYPLGFAKDYWYGKYQGIRTAEMYLNRAEAYARKFQKEGNDTYRIKALNDLNELRKYRLNNAFEVQPLEVADAQMLIDLCLQERRKELSGEMNHRWFDLRRNGMPELSHFFFTDPAEGKVEYKLNKNGYLLPIPEEAIRLNTKLEQNDRK